MAGLLAAHILRRKGREPVIHELQPTLPDNHGALLRFRTSAVADATGIPFKKVRVHKALWDGKRLRTIPTLRDNNHYSLKVAGSALQRSILSLEPVDRYIAPSDFLKRLAEGFDIRFNSSLADYAEAGDGSVPLISTVPMSTLADILGVSLPVSFEAKKIWTDTVLVEEPTVDVYQTVYFTEPSEPLYRASLTGNRLTMEYMNNPSQGFTPTQKILADIFGVDYRRLTALGVKSQRFGKLIPIDDEARRSFIMYATDKHRIYSVGRFATWRQILLDDVVNDVEVVHKIMSQVDRYGFIREQSKKG